MARRPTGGMQLDGAIELRAFFSASSKLVKNLSRTTVKELAEDVQRGAQARAPEKSGALVDAIKVRTQVSGGKFSAVVWVDQGMVPYAVQMHEGMPIGIPYSLGPRSEAKNTGVPHAAQGVGWKFLYRSHESVYRHALRRINKILEGVNNLAVLSRRRATSKFRKMK